MKKITRLCKIFLVLVTIFSQLSSVVTVLAEEVLSKPLNIVLEQVTNEDYGYVEYYDFSYISQNNDYEEKVTIESESGEEIVDKTYDIVLTSSFTYLDGVTTDVKIDEIEDVTGESLNNTRNVKKLDPISKYFDGTFNLNVKVLDEETILYETDMFYVVNNTFKGLVGNLNGDIVPTYELVGQTSIGNFEISEENVYVQKLRIMPGELTPNKNYRIVYSDGTKSEVMNGLALAEINISGTTTDLTGKLSGEYSYSDGVTVEEVDGETVVNEYIYEYDATIKYGTDNDELLSGMYGITFEDGYIIVPAKNYMEATSVITIGEIVTALENTGITLEVFDAEENVIDYLTNVELLEEEVKNNYVLKFVNGATASYTVVVLADANSDNEFNSDDMLPTINGYMEEEEILSMDLVDASEEEVFGTVTFEDVMFANENLKENPVTDVEENSNLTLLFGDVPTELFVGDTFELDVIVNSDEVEDYIDGIDAIVTTNDNLKLTDVKFNSEFIGSYNLDGRLVGAGSSLVNEDVVVTLVFMTTLEGNGTITLNGKLAKYLNINEFDELTKEVEIIRNVSSNNYLSSLNASVGTFDSSFDKDVTVYTLTVPYDTESVILSGALDDIYSSVTGLYEYELTEDKTTAIITVTAEDGSTKVYTVYIIKEAAPVSKPIVYYYSSNTYLKTLEIDGYEIEFDKYTEEYKITVKNSVDSLDIKALAEDYRSSVEITGNENFKEGENTVTITVTAENGNTREYKIIVDKAEESKGTTDVDDSSNTAEKVVIIILIVLVVLGLLYLIFKKDEGENTEDNNVQKSKNNEKKVNNSNKKQGKNKK
ncbi:MAG: cadherin-like beta sandwich domain-containing protein [Bacilli bacterium]|nr:cadherin-like beta sandwich domain-containing protein [Bacilli bacterium]